MTLYRAGERDRRMLFGLKHKPRQLMLGTGEQPIKVHAVSGALF